jgi:hypothetical protein
LTTWNYRIVRDVHKVGDEEHASCTIREVYYDEDGKITSWTKEPCYPAGETWEECFDNHAIMGRALGTAIVDVSSGEAVEVPLRVARRKR